VTDALPSADAAAKAAAKQMRRRLYFQLAALALIVAAAPAGLGLAWWMRPQTAPKTEDSATGLTMPTHLFRGWEKPDLVLVVTASQHGYLLPCGCSKPQKGGLERRYNFIQLLKERGWPVVAVDLGDVPQMKGPAGLPNHQGLLKYTTAMKAMKIMDYTAVGVGEYDASLSLFKLFGEYSLNDPKPRVVAGNLKEAEKKFPEETAPWAAAEKSPVKVGVSSIVSPLIAKKINDPQVEFTFGQQKPGVAGPSSPAVEAVLKDMIKSKIELPVMLYMGSLTKSKEEGFPPEATAFARTYPGFPLIVGLDDSDEPRGNPIEIPVDKQTKSLLVAVGHKAKYVGVVGVWRTGKPAQPFEFKYQLVEMSEDFLTPADKEAGHPILKLMDEYTETLKRDDYLSKYSQAAHPAQAAAGEGKMPKFVGSERCADCHAYATEVWKKSDEEDRSHSHAYKTLVDAKRPTNRQHDPECIVCHTVGFSYKTGFQNADKTPKLKDVGCESCHGPASLHVNSPNDEALAAALNPWKAPEKETEVEKKRRIGRIDAMCQRCHDSENDVNWTRDGFEKRWAKVAHPTPRE
jgi:hypothetical protein